MGLIDSGDGLGIGEVDGEGDGSGGARNCPEWRRLVLKSGIERVEFSSIRVESFGNVPLHLASGIDMFS